jgi:hypothetical protein
MDEPAAGGPSREASPALARGTAAERDGMPDERTLYACTGHSVAEVRMCESVFVRHAVLESPLACHSVASGLPRTSKTIVVDLDLRGDPSDALFDAASAEAPAPAEESSSDGSID